MYSPVPSKTKERKSHKWQCFQLYFEEYKAVLILKMVKIQVITLVHALSSKADWQVLALLAICRLNFVLVYYMGNSEPKVTGRKKKDSV